VEVEDEVGEGGLVQGIGERRPVLVRIDEGGGWCCSARPELEEEVSVGKNRDGAGEDMDVLEAVLEVHRMADAWVRSPDCAGRRHGARVGRAQGVGETKDLFELA